MVALQYRCICELTDTFVGNGDVAAYGHGPGAIRVFGRDICQDDWASVGETEV